ncbi:MAG: SAM-dependent methyltransferase [Solirubrobacterales bacterium]|nr:MAG: SAM-dependent methyltransferase [Solirubrobacterales bacterium]
MHRPAVHARILGRERGRRDRSRRPDPAPAIAQGARPRAAGAGRARDGAGVRRRLDRGRRAQRGAADGRHVRAAAAVAAPAGAAGARARAARACGLVLPPRAPGSELRLRGERHTLTRDRRAVRHHYDVGNEFFALFLDVSMTYSCAYFSGGAATLEQAQEAKLELVCTKLALEEGERVLDVGCGWGSFALHAARRHGAQVLGVTLSEPQAQLARQHARNAGLTDRVEILVADYRELGDERFDAIASIGMVEHVGQKRIDVYAHQLAGLLRPGGRLLNHGIAKLKDFDTPDEGDFSERFVSPDGVPLALSRVELALERAGLVTTHAEGLAGDYAETLRHWIERFESRYEDAVRLAGPERARVWRLYLRAARLGFVTGWASVYQVLAHRP